ncbi:MAG: hypothetical protein HKM06_06490 [Spirochaetales bacterium]|nr:hypothetical protein [Spirochaetales bacterium]
MLFLMIFWTLSALGSLWAFRLEPLKLLKDLPPPGVPLTLPQIIRLSLVFSGASEATTASDEKFLNGLAAQLKNQLSGFSNEALGEHLLLTLHQMIFKNYSLLQTRVDTLLATGAYNCVSSALVYTILGRALGLDVQAVSVPSHVFCRVVFPDRSVDVETTTAEGFDPGTKKEFHDHFTGATGYTYVPPGNYRERTDIGARGLLGLLLQNKIAAYEASGEPLEALGPAIDRWTLERSSQAFETLSLSFQNAIAFQNGREEYPAALELIKNLEKWTGTTALVHRLADTVVSNQANKLLQLNKPEEALKLADDWRSSGELDPQAADKIRQVAWDNQLSTGLDALSEPEAVKKINAAFQSRQISSERRLKLLTWVEGQQLVKTSNTQGPQAGLDYWKGLPEELRQTPQMSEFEAQLKENWAAQIHNDFARLWNSRQPEQAKKILQEGLKELPDSQLLNADWNAIQTR